MSIRIKPELEKMIEEKIGSGRYGSANEVVEAAMRLLDEQEWLYERRREELRKELQIGIDQADRGQFTTRTPEQILESVYRRLREDADEAV